MTIFARLSDRLLELVVPGTPAAAVTCSTAINRCKSCFMSSFGYFGQARYKVTCCTNGDCYGTTGPCLFTC